ncbi:MAG: hypothetical protein Q8L48_02515 [Archangium sp.]|nr:hypothetical protein [Archangium sp.]
MTPRTVHLIILAVLCSVPACFGAYLVVKGDRSHSDLSGIAVAAGLALVAASAVYAAISSLLVWKLGTTPRRVFAVHGGVVLTVTAFVGLPRLYWLVAR